MNISPLFKRFQIIAYEQAGIDIKDGKEALISARISRRMRALSLVDAKEYLNYLESDKKGEELIHFLDAISTNFTSFFREPDHFDLLAKLARDWRQSGQKRIRIWSAASSSGEEPYSIAFVIDQALNEFPKDIKILASDISTRMLKIATAGCYERSKLSNIPRGLVNTYFEHSSSEDPERACRVKEHIRQMILFRRINLSETPFPMTGPFDVIFCRNVMIYFDKLVRQKLIGEVERLLKIGGILFIGHTETLTGLTTSLKMSSPSIYIKQDHCI